MKKPHKIFPYLALFLCLLSNINGKAQTTYQISTYGKTPDAFSYLLLRNDVISRNDTINEQIVDLVVPVLTDSMIERKKQHHKVVMGIGWMIHAFGGFNWRAVSMKKEKFVGTVFGNSRSGEELFTEYDINFDLYFHLPKYLKRVFVAYDKQGKIKRQDVRPKHHTNYKVSPFVRDTNNINIREYRLHCELTPPKAFRPQLNYLFYPTLPSGGGMKEHPNFKNPNPTVGFYGTYCLDCNHSCHPELHPYEWMWWLKNNDRDSSFVKEWNIGIFHESSNRLKKWSINPSEGKISVPFTFRAEKPAKITIEHLVMNEFVENGLPSLALSQASFKADQSQQILTVKGNDGFNKNIEVSVVNPLRTQGLVYWLSDLHYDANTGILSGYFNYAVSVKDLYTCKLRFE